MRSLSTVSNLSCTWDGARVWASEGVCMWMHVCAVVYHEAQTYLHGKLEPRVTFVDDVANIAQYLCVRNESLQNMVPAWLWTLSNVAVRKDARTVVMRSSGITHAISSMSLALIDPYSLQSQIKDRKSIARNDFGCSFSIKY